MTFKLILPLSDIPAGSVVTKVRGTNEYIVRDSITIYTPEGKVVIPATDGCKFLCGEEGSIQAVDGGTELIWLCTPDELYQLAAGYVSGDE